MNKKLMIALCAGIAAVITLGCGLIPAPTEIGPMTDTLGKPVVPAVAPPLVVPTGTPVVIRETVEVRVTVAPPPAVVQTVVVVQTSVPPTPLPPVVQTVVVMQTAVPQPTPVVSSTPVLSLTVTAPKAVSLRYDNAGCVTNDGLAAGQTKTVAWYICNSSSPSEAWVAIQAEAAAVGAETITAPAGTEINQALRLGTAWVVWNSTCPSGKPKVDVSLPSANLPGAGCIRFVPEFGAGDRVVTGEQMIAVH